MARNSCGWLHGNSNKLPLKPPLTPFAEKKKKGAIQINVMSVAKCMEKKSLGGQQWLEEPQGNAVPRVCLQSQRQSIGGAPAWQHLPKPPSPASLAEPGHSKGSGPCELFVHSFPCYPAVKTFSTQAGSCERSPSREFLNTGKRATFFFLSLMVGIGEAVMTREHLFCLPKASSK